MATFLKKRLQHGCLPVKFVKFLRTPFFTEHLQGLILLLLKEPPGADSPASQGKLKVLMVAHVLHFFTVTSYRRETIFYGFFLSKCFHEK